MRRTRSLEERAGFIPGYGTGANARLIAATFSETVIDNRINGIL